MVEKQLEYPISPRYIPDWTVAEALRELIANALDTQARVNFKYDDGVAVIEDKGDGIPQSFWVLGEGMHGQIGQFGEGLKMAMLVLARENRGVVVETVGYTVRPTIRYSDSYQSDILYLEYQDDPRSAGTRVLVECSVDEYADAINRFLAINPLPKVQANLPILDEPGQLYINGVWVQSLSNMIWGYDFDDKEMANRDRSVLDGSRLRDNMRDVLEKLTRFDAIVKLLELSQDSEFKHKQEMQLSLLPSKRALPVWRRAFRNVFGDKAALTSSRATVDRELQSLGWYVVTDIAYGILDTLRRCGIEDADEVLRRLHGRKFIWPNTPLDDDESRILREAKSIAADVIPADNTKVSSVQVVEEFPYDSAVCTTNGLYRDGKVYIRRSCLSDLASAVGTLIHERIHGMGYFDESRQFEHKMTEVMGSLAARSYSAEK